MAVRFAVLALLAERPLHGYAVHALFQDRLGDFLELNYGQVYQVLTALERQGLVLAGEVRIGRRPWRKVYELTPGGRDALARWLREHRGRRRPFRDDFYIRLHFAASACPDEVDAMIADQLARARSELHAARDRRQAFRVAERGPELARALFAEAATMHAEASVRALEAAREASGRLRAERCETEPALATGAEIAGEGERVGAFGAGAARRRGARRSAR
jgi:DNA-binding PadR family transcriptional regulator